MAETYTVRFEDLDREIEVPANQSILEAAEEAGMDLPYQCRMGVCGVCSAKCVDGAPNEIDQSQGMFLSTSEKEEGYVLTCIGKPLSEVVLESDESP